MRSKLETLVSRCFVAVQLCTWRSLYIISKLCPWCTRLIQNRFKARIQPIMSRNHIVLFTWYFYSYFLYNWYKPRNRKIPIKYDCHVTHAGDENSKTTLNYNLTHPILTVTFRSYCTTTETMLNYTFFRTERKSATMLDYALSRTVLYSYCTKRPRRR